MESEKLRPEELFFVLNLALVGFRLESERCILQGVFYYLLCNWVINYHIVLIVFPNKLRSGMLRNGT